MHPYEFRIVTFAKEEGSVVSGAMVLLLSKFANRVYQPYRARLPS